MKQKHENFIKHNNNEWKEEKDINIYANLSAEEARVMRDTLIKEIKDMHKLNVE